MEAGYQWLTPVILATQEAEIRKIMNQSKPQANSLQTLSGKKNPSQKRACGMVQGVCLSSNPTITKKKRNYIGRQRN
jgi:hypothetical protein